MSSFKINNNILAFLKIYFERNNKTNSTVAVFGNVFKNSKWSDFKTQNIKKSFSKQWFFLVLSLIIPFTLIYYFKLIPLLNILIVLHLIKQMFFDLIYEVYILFLYCILQFTIFLYYPNLNSFRQLSKVQHQTSLISTPSNNYFFKNSNLNKFFWNATVINIVGTKTQFNQTNPILFNNLNLKTSSDLFFFKNNTKLNSLTTLNNVNFVLSSNLNPQFQNINFINKEQTQSNPLSLFFKKYLFLNENLTKESLNMIKQYRWLTKNYLNTSLLNQNSNFFTESKSFLANPFLNLNTLDRNIWISNTISKTTPNYLSTFNNTYSYELLKNYNFYESSRFFTNMRYYYLINFTSLSPTYLYTKTKQHETNLNSTVFNNFEPTQYVQLLDFNFNNLILNPEKKTYLNQNINLNLGNSIDNSQTHLVLNVSEVLQNQTLELFSYVNSNSLNIDNSWPYNNYNININYKS